MVSAFQGRGLEPTDTLYVSARTLERNAQKARLFATHGAGARLNRELFENDEIGKVSGDCVAMPTRASKRPATAKNRELPSGMFS